MAGLKKLIFKQLEKDVLSLFDDEDYVGELYRKDLQFKGKHGVPPDPTDSDPEDYKRDKSLGRHNMLVATKIARLMAYKHLAFELSDAVGKELAELGTRMEPPVRRSDNFDLAAYAYSKYGVKVVHAEDL